MTIRAEKLIRKDNNRAFHYILDFERINTWRRDFTDVLFITPAPIKKGSYLVLTRKIFFLKEAQTFEVVNLSGNRKIHLKRVPPYKSEIIYTINIIEDHLTMLKIKDKIELNGFQKLFYPIIFLSKKIQLYQSLNRLESQLNNSDYN